MIPAIMRRFLANARNDISLIRIKGEKWRFAPYFRKSNRDFSESPLLPMLSAQEPVIPNEVRNLDYISNHSYS